MSRLTHKERELSAFPQVSLLSLNDDPDIRHLTAPSPPASGLMPAPSASTPLSTYPSAQPHLSSAYDNAFSSPPNQPRPDLPADSSVSLNSSSAVSSSASSSAASHASTSLARSAGKRLILPALDWVERMDWIERLGGRFELVEERVLGGYAMYAVGDWYVHET
jgi:hypothetical protein